MRKHKERFLAITDGVIRVHFNGAIIIPRGVIMKALKLAQQGHFDAGLGIQRLDLQALFASYRRFLKMPRFTVQPG